MKVQQIIDYLSAGYDEGAMTRADVKKELEQFAEKGYIAKEMVERLFDLIV